MLIFSFFTDAGVPKTGLTPTIDVWESDGTQVVTAQSMTEVAGGFYKYDFTTYDESKDYSIRADGTATLNNSERYKFATNDLGQVTEDMTDIKGTGFVKDTDSLKTVKDGQDSLNVLVTRVLGLSQENYRVTGAIYNFSGGLTSATIKLFGSATDCTNDVNPIATYGIVATYDDNNRMLTYKVVKN